LTVLVGGHVLQLATDTFFVLNVGLVLLWLVLGVDVIRRHRRLVEEAAGS
jgi:hypothetical protein